MASYLTTVDTVERAKRRRKPGRKPTSFDVARAVGVSQSAVSRASTEGGKVAKRTRERILKVADKIGYVPNIHARSLITRQTGMIALVMGDMTNPFYPEVLEALAGRLQAAGKRAVLFNVSRHEAIDDALAGLLKYHVDGLIVASALPSTSITKLSAKAHSPVILFNRTIKSALVDSVSCDNLSGGRLIADRFLDARHRRLAFIAGLDGASTSVQRERGYNKGAISRTGRLPARANGHFTYEGGADAAIALFSRADPPDAVFAANDIMAWGALDAIRTKVGLKVPNDASLVGFDNIAAAAWPSYSLTTFAQPISRMIDETLKILVDYATQRQSELPSCSRPTCSSKLRTPVRCGY